MRTATATKFNGFRTSTAVKIVTEWIPGGNRVGAAFSAEATFGGYSSDVRYGATEAAAKLNAVKHLGLAIAFASATEE